MFRTDVDVRDSWADPDNRASCITDEAAYDQLGTRNHWLIETVIQLQYDK